MVTKIIKRYVFYVLGNCSIVAITFDLFWMCRTRFDIFALIMNFINKIWVFCHIIVGLFEVHKLLRATLTKQMNPLLIEFIFTNKSLLT